MNTPRIAALLLAVMIIFAASQCVSRIGGSGVSEITQDVDTLDGILAEIAFTSPHTEDSHIYQISFRTCPPCIQAHKNMLPKLQEAGVETRLVTIARRGNSTADERAAVVENARRGWSFTQAWWEDNSPRRFYAQTDIPPADGDKARTAELERLQYNTAHLARVFAKNGKRFAFPTFIWQGQDGRYKAAVGYSQSLKNVILSDMNIEPKI